MSDNVLTENAVAYEIDFSGPGITEQLYVSGKPKNSKDDLPWDAAVLELDL